LIGTGAEKRGKVLAVWKSNAVQNRIRNLTQNMPWLWDGNKIAWYILWLKSRNVTGLICNRTSYQVSELRIMVDLDLEKSQMLGRPYIARPQPGK
jgi:eukaryotic translation initiation factor 2C